MINLRITPTSLIHRYAAFAAAAFTVLVGASFFWNIINFDNQVEYLATEEARANWDKDHAFRSWATDHGGLYVKPNERTPPNPYLAHLPNRDVETTDGVKLTLMNPAYMMRQMTQEYEALYGVKGKITGQILLNPANEADAWELKALKQFDLGAKEVLGKANIGGVPYIRLMRPMVMTEGCVLCHGHLGFKVGDIRGGVSVSIPLAPYLEVSRNSKVSMSWTHGIVWLLGIMTLAFITLRWQLRQRETREAEKALRESEKRLRGAIESMREGFVLFDTDDRIVMINDVYRKINPRAQEFLDQNMCFEDLIRANFERGWMVNTPDEIEQFIQDRLKKHRNPGPPITRQFADGKWYILKETATPEGGVALTFDEVSELIQAKNAAHHALDLAEKANQAKSEFLASMSHELRTPLNAVLGFGQMMQFSPNDPLTPNQSEYVGNILEGGNHLLDLVNEILDLASIEADQLDLSLVGLEANDIVSNCVELVAPLAEARNLKIIDQFSNQASVFLFTDRTRLKQILINLLSNAIKFNKEGGTVTVEGTKTDYEYLRISVTDTGIGIPKEDRSSMFNLFHRVNTDPKIATEGTGIGLMVTKLLVQRMAGRIGFESEAGVGSTFWIDLPLASNEDVLIWTDAIKTGVDPIDKDHQVLVSMLNRLSRRSAAETDVDDIINELVAYTQYHFSREEAIMEVCGYPDYEEHCDLHQRLIDSINQHSEAWRNERNQRTLVLLRTFLKEWLFNHILKEDTKIANCTKGKDRDIRQKLTAQGLLR